MNALHEQYSKKGLTIVGVTGEPESKINSFIVSRGIKYTIAIGGASGYKTRGIPHAWLVAPGNPGRNVVWEGHPARLNNGTIDANLKYVRLRPVFKLPDALSRAEKYLNAGRYASGVKELDRYLKRPKDAEVEAAAKAAKEKLTTYGKQKLDQAALLVKERDFADAVALLEEIEDTFKGIEAGDTAKKQLSALKRNKDAKVELTAQRYLDKAEGYLKRKKYKLAAKYLRALVSSKKYGSTKVAERAEKKLDAIAGYL